MAERREDPAVNSTLRNNERPFLYPWNRRLRHLHGISLRNLHVTTANPKRQAKTITDDDAPFNLTSPAKRALQGDSKSLVHSRSFTSLSIAVEDGPIVGALQKASTSYEKDEKPQSRPGGHKLRRRSTLHWNSTTPRVRQSKLEDMVVNRMTDTWVSVHCPGVPEPIYISEVIERSMNPSFAFCDLENSGPLISRSSDCTIRVWARPSNTEDYCLLVELDLNLQSLQFVGRSLDNFHHPLPQNCILLHLSDGIYTSFTDLPADPHLPVEHSIDHRAGNSKIGSTFDALMQLANLDECIQDAMKVRMQLEEDINEILGQRRVVGQPGGGGSLENDEPPQIRTAIVSEEKKLRQMIRRRDELQESLDQRHRFRREGRDAEARSRSLVDDRTKEFQELDLQHHGFETHATGQLRRICESLLTIFPIEPLKNKTLQFTIRGIHLPNSNYNDTNRDEIAAALGFTAQLVHQLALYLSMPLPYELEPYGSASFISDPISIGISQRRYPLHPTSVPYKFEYGVFLLNKDVEFLMNRVGLRVLDVRHTLPNLKYLLYVLTAGTGDMPARKAGGVRGLMGARAPDSLRRDSSDSVKSLPTPSKQDSGLQMNGELVAAKEKEGHDPFLSSSPARGLLYRQRFSSIPDR